jgi:hypothetical protein
MGAVSTDDNPACSIKTNDSNTSRQQLHVCRRQTSCNLLLNIVTGCVRDANYSDGDGDGDNRLVIIVTAAAAIIIQFNSILVYLHANLTAQ